MDNPVQGNDGKYKYQIERISPLFRALTNSQGQVLQVLIDHLKRLLQDNKEAQPSVVGDMGTALSELNVLGITVSDSDGSELLDQAASKGDLAAVKFLVQHLPNSITESAYSSGTLLKQAASTNQVEVLQFLINAGINLDPVVASTALESAALNNNIEAAQLLLEHGACANPSTGIYTGHSLKILQTPISKDM